MQKFVLGAACVLCCGTLAYGTPPEYKSFDRDQRITSPITDPDSVLRIWMIYVEQGDSLLIQLPTKFNYDPDDQDGTNENSERIDVLIDAGSSPTSESDRARAFINALYPESPTIEHVVITHHDQDHVVGMVPILNDQSIAVQNIFHNGLASYRPGVTIAGMQFPTTGNPTRPAIFDKRRGRITRGMAFLDENGNFLHEFVVNDLDRLRQLYDRDALQGVYHDLAEAVLGKTAPEPVSTFQRAVTGADFINEASSAQLGDPATAEISFNVIWPQSNARKYGDWGETINGNSVAIRLEYGAFSMLFMGDHNKQSQRVLLDHLTETNQQKLLNCDVLKVPHHGSHHALEEFFRHDELNPVVSVASMGKRGFKSKSLNNNVRNWQHPSTEVIKWLGGSHRVYHTYIHEKPFKWEDLTTEADHEEMIERKHILIETDGIWFRVVETTSPTIVPTVKKTTRTHGTRWIKAERS